MERDPNAGEPRRAFGSEGVRNLLIEALRNRKPPEDIPAFLPPTAPQGRPLVDQNEPVATQVAPETENAPAALPGAQVPMPTADEVARAIVAAAREAGEDPIDCAMRKEKMRCRHYAMHALEHCFPGLPATTYARLVGAPGKPVYFYKNSKSSVIRTVGPTGKRCSPWWSEAAYDRVIRAIRP